MPKHERKITPADIIPLDEYLKIRKERRTALVALKKNRRLEIGPVASCLFENYDTMLHQILEMLAIEKGGHEQLPDELHAYNPMIPQGRELTCTVMFEIDDPFRRAKFLEKLGGIEETMFVEFAGEKIMATPETDVDRTSADGKASSVQFIHFHFTNEQVAKFKTAQAVMVGFDHPQYPHLVKLSTTTHAELCGDFA